MKFSSEGMGLKNFILSACFILVFMISGCGDKASKDAAKEARDSGRLQAFEIDDLQYVVGYGEWDGDTFKIRDIDGRIWNVPSSVRITKEEVTEESFKKRSKKDVNR
jgi:hypothetical protein